MQLDFNQTYNFVLKEVYVPIILETAEGNQYSIAMRDNTIEIVAIGNSPAPRVFHPDKGKEYQF